MSRTSAHGACSLTHRPFVTFAQVGVDPGIVYPVNYTDPRDPTVVRQFSRKHIDNTMTGKFLREHIEARRRARMLVDVPTYKAATEAVAGVTTRTCESAKLLEALQMRGRNFRRGGCEQ